MYSHPGGGGGLKPMKMYIFFFFFFEQKYWGKKEFQLWRGCEALHKFST